MNRIRVSLMVFGVVALAAIWAPAGAAVHQKPGMGSTLKAWKKVYGEKHGPGDTCSAKNVCFGAPVHDPTSGRTWQFAPVDFAGGIAGAYSQNFFKGSTLAEVEAAIKAMLPHDVVFPPVTVDKNGGSCGMLNIMSPTLAKELGAPKIGDPQGVIGIELNLINANLDSFYDPSNIQTASLEPLAVDPTQSC
jgi:hypothetical protein